MKLKRFHGQQDFQHGRSPRMGVVLVNLGTPDAPTSSAVRRYLAEFLSDRRVVEIPALIWKLILHGIVLRVRPKRSAEAYSRVWEENGSPLMSLTQSLTDRLRERLEAIVPGPVQVACAMRYGNPSIESVLLEAEKAGVERLLVLPLYPQYSGATTGSVADGVFKTLSQWRWVPELRLAGAYHDSPAYIGAVAASIRQHWEQHGRGDKLMLSFHGMPRATLEAGDPYFCHCHKTARLITTELGLADQEWEMAFQSRFGAAAWLQPYVASRLEELPAEGVKHLTVICPGFAVDCLETLDEIAVEGRDSFIAAGGEKFSYIPSLNDSQEHVDMFVEQVINQASDWRELDGVMSSETEPETSHRLALEAGAPS